MKHKKSQDLHLILQYTLVWETHKVIFSICVSQQLIFRGILPSFTSTSLHFYIVFQDTLNFADQSLHCIFCVVLGYTLKCKKLSPLLFLFLLFALNKRHKNNLGISSCVSFISEWMDGLRVLNMVFYNPYLIFQFPSLSLPVELFIRAFHQKQCLMMGLDST